MAEPKSFISGDTVSWTFSNSLYPASSGWTLKYFLNANNKYEISGSMIVASGDDFTVTVPAADSAKYVPGWYKLIPQVSKSGDVHTFTEIAVEVKENPAKATPKDGRSTWIQCRDQLKPVILAGSTYGFKGQTITTPLGTSYAIDMKTIDELRKEYAFYESMIRKDEDDEREAQGLSRRSYKLRFGQA